LEGARNVAEKIRAKISNHLFEFNGNKISISVTIGIAEFDTTKTLDIVIKESDIALYTGKQSGKDQVVIFTG